MRRKVLAATPQARNAFHPQWFAATIRRESTDGECEGGIKYQAADGVENRKTLTGVAVRVVSARQAICMCFKCHHK